VAEPSDRKSQPKGEHSAKAQELPRERRASHRVSDDQQTGEGSASALSKMKMLERKRAPLRKIRDDY
jgi:hypothetical protein